MRYCRKGKGAFCAYAAERLSNGPLASRYPTRSKSSPVGLQWASSAIRSKVDMPEALNHSGLGPKGDLPAWSQVTAQTIPERFGKGSKLRHTRASLPQQKPLALRHFPNSREQVRPRLARSPSLHSTMCSKRPCRPRASRAATPEREVP